MYRCQHIIAIEKAKIGSYKTFITKTQYSKLPVLPGAQKRIITMRNFQRLEGLISGRKTLRYSRSPLLARDLPGESPWTEGRSQSMGVS